MSGSFSARLWNSIFFPMSLSMYLFLAFISLFNPDISNKE